jgi:protein SCO1/2
MTRLALTTFLSLLLLSACQADWHTQDISPLMPPLAFQLTDETGQQTTANDYLGKINLVFLGFTHCQSACPATLSRLASLLDALPQSQRQQINVLFVSVDPKRDSPQQLTQYTKGFGPRFIGLTGTQDQLQTLHKRYRITYGYGNASPTGSYMVSHSAGVFVFAKDGSAQLLLQPNDSSKAIIADLRRLSSKR